MLNYAYGVLENRVRMHVLAAGMDPRIGYLHGSYGGKHGFVYDIMEPLRPVIDRRILEFVQSQAFAPQDFVMAGDGACRLNSQLARCLVKVAERDFRYREFDKANCSRDIDPCSGQSIRWCNSRKIGHSSNTRLSSKMLKMEFLPKSTHLPLG